MDLAEINTDPDVDEEQVITIEVDEVDEECDCGNGTFSIDCCDQPPSGPYGFNVQDLGDDDN